MSLGVPFTRNHLKRKFRRLAVQSLCEQKENIQWFPVNEVSGFFFFSFIISRSKIRLVLCERISYEVKMPFFTER